MRSVQLVEALISCNASSYGLGAVLTQSGRPIFFVSRLLTEPEKKFVQIDKEFGKRWFGHLSNWTGLPTGIKCRQIWTIVHLWVSWKNQCRTWPHVNNALQPGWRGMTLTCTMCLARSSSRQIFCQEPRWLKRFASVRNFLTLCSRPMKFCKFRVRNSIFCWMF